jgi:hypothetical protein
MAQSVLAPPCRAKHASCLGPMTCLPLASSETNRRLFVRTSFRCSAGDASTPTPHTAFGCQHYDEFADDVSECLDAETDDALRGRAGH